MLIKIIAVGKIKKGYIKEGISDFSRRIEKYTALKIIEVADEKAPASLSLLEREIVKQKEGERILSHIKENSVSAALSIDGAAFSTEQFASFIQHKKINSVKELSFIIGGSEGLCGDVLKAVNYSISFSKMTFPHELMRLILLEQIYRAEKIQRGETYHK